MSYSTIIYTTKDHVAYITLNRPQALNVYNLKMRDELYQVLGAIKDDTEVRVVIFSDAGERAFCEGGGVEKPVTVFSAANAVAAIEKPVIAAINGDALRPGLELEARLAGSVI